MTGGDRDERSPDERAGTDGESAGRAAGERRRARPEDEAHPALASPPCYLDEIDPAYAGLSFPAPPVLPSDWQSVRRWRAERRKALGAARLALPPATHAAHSACIADALTQLLRPRGPAVVAAYWPIRGEPDLRPWMRARAGAGRALALPVIVERGMPLRFRLWAPGERLVRGVWNIPAPATGEEVVPDAVIAPLVGFDRARHRLGNGGGYFDRTLATLCPRPFVVGVGFALGALSTIFAQPHDVAMDAIVTERGLLA